MSKGCVPQYENHDRTEERSVAEGFPHVDGDVLMSVTAHELLHIVPQEADRLQARGVKIGHIGADLVNYEAVIVADVEKIERHNRLQRAAAAPGSENSPGMLWRRRRL
jgi:hypothetical protein